MRRPKGTGGPFLIADEVAEMERTRRDRKEEDDKTQKTSPQALSRSVAKQPSDLNRFSIKLSQVIKEKAPITPRLVHQELPLSPSYSAPPTPGAHVGEEGAASVYSLPVDPPNQVVLAKMKPAHLSLSGPIFGGDIPEDIGYEIYKLGTLIQALNPKCSKIDEGW